MKKRNKQILGYLLILLGISIPLYGFSGLSRSILVDRKGYKNFANASVDPKQLSVEEEKIIRYNDKVGGKEPTIVDPFATDDFKTDYKISEDPDAIFAYLKIPKLDLLQPIRLDASQKHMAQGAAHVDGTALPVGGKGQRSVIAGHRGYYQSIMFLNLDELVVGDEVFIERNKKELTYKVAAKEIISPSQWEKLKPEEGKDILTLLTCEPFFPPRPYRLLVHCERVVEEVPVAEKAKVVSVEGKKVPPSQEIQSGGQSRVKLIKYSVLIFTGLGWVFFFFMLLRFLLFLRKKEE